MKYLAVKTQSTVHDPMPIWRQSHNKRHYQVSDIIRYGVMEVAEMMVHECHWQIGMHDI